MTSQQHPLNGERNPSNSSEDGKNYEKQVRLLTFLNLKPGQQLTCEMKCANPFDDLILWMIENDPKPNNHYYFRQLKHKQNPSLHSIVYDSNFRPIKQPSEPKYHYLFGRDSDYYLPKYYDKFYDMHKNFEENGKSLIRELSIMTNIGIEQQTRQAKFQEVTAHSAWGKMQTPNSKRYKFKQCQEDKFLKDLEVDIKKASKKKPKILKNNYDETIAKKFFDLLVFEVNQPSLGDMKEELMNKIESFLPNYIKSDKKLKEEALSLFKDLPLFEGDSQLDGTLKVKWLTSLDREQIFASIAPSLISTQLDKKYEKTIDTISGFVTFRDEQKKKEYFSYLSAVLNEEKNIFLIQCDSKATNSTLATWKVHEYFKKQSVQNYGIHYAEKKSGLKKIRTVVGEHLEGYFAPTEKFYIIIQMAQEYNLGDFFSEIDQLSKNMGNFKLIFISDSLPERNIDYVKVIQDFPLEWGIHVHLEDAAREEIFKKTLTLKESKKEAIEARRLESKETSSCWKISLKSLEMIEKKISEWLDPAALAEFITNNDDKPLYLGLPNYDSDLDNMYINRKIMLPVFKNPTYTGHSFNADGLWIESSNTNAGEVYEELKKYVTRSKDSDHEIDESDLLKDNVSFGTLSPDNKLVVVVDYPGKGKSWLLSSITNQFYQNHCESDLMPRLIFKINLHEVNSSAWMAEKQFESEKDAVDNLVSCFLPINPLSRAIVKQACLNESMALVYLLFDGFDEINAKQREITYGLIEKLLKAKGIKRIVLASRPDNDLESKIEARFKQFPLHLKDFTEEDQVQFLTKQWNRKLPEQSVNSTELKDYAQQLVTHSNKVLERSGDKPFLGIPLQCLIAAECFFAKLQDYLKEKKKDPNLQPTFQNEKFDLVHLYDTFYDTKLDVLFHDKANYNRQTNEASLFIKNYLVQNSCARSIQRLSIFHLMSIEDAEVISGIKWETYKKRPVFYYKQRNVEQSEYSSDLERARRMGFLRGVKEEFEIEELKLPHVKFLHRTFAEYFFATFLVENYNIELYGSSGSQLLEKEGACEILVEKVFKETEFEGVRRFFYPVILDHIYSHGRLPPSFIAKIGRNLLHYACTYYKGEDLSQVIRVLIEGGGKADACNKYGGNPLHIACTYYKGEDLSQVIRVLIKEGGAKADACDKLGMNPLHFACTYYKGEDLSKVIQVLIAGGAKADVRDNFGMNAREYYVAQTKENKSEEIIRLLS